MKDADYIALLRETRKLASALGLGAVDERIVSGLKRSEGPFWDLIFYLKHLREEIKLGSDSQYRETLRRARQYVTTEAGGPIKGIRIDFSPEDAQRYGTRELIVTPSPELDSIGNDLEELIVELGNDREQNSESKDLK